MLAYSGLYLPFKRTRAAVYIALTLSSIIAGASCVNAIKKLRTHKTQIKMVLEGDQAISIDNADIENAGILLFVVGMLLSMQVGNFLLMLIKDWFKPEWPPSFMQPRNGVAMSTSTLRAQSWYLLVNTLAILAVFIPAAHFTANGSFKIGATSAGAPGTLTCT
ncbi:hypothetical protein SISNIDRAFT_455019 [Sistotremastrum niveocremeum HHB9708]|uniref:Uncharacterized protein n=2 Tax=Sistotremastraceae TaxID=3402574 RepID=A0A164UAM3_9AGAM|nr:hypothetical protein SISNIDRAFT_455019 [Sistotremastrum niveocremeum HHB9708]KZT40120.1 hypothetical protein SISSUDRAFT_1044735 [Sistotremastrum suecicum HHB10207 ss-3]